MASKIRPAVAQFTGTSVFDSSTMTEAIFTASKQVTLSLGAKRPTKYAAMTVPELVIISISLHNPFSRQSELVFANLAPINLQASDSVNPCSPEAKRLAINTLLLIGII